MIIVPEIVSIARLRKQIPPVHWTGGIVTNALRRLVGTGRLPEPVDERGSVIFSAKTESETARQSEHGHETGDNGVDDAYSDIQFNQSGQKTEDGYRPPGQRAKEVGSVQLRAHNRSRSQLPHKVGQDNGSEHYQDGHHDVRNVIKNIPQERRESEKSQNIGSGEKERYGHKPVNYLTDKPRTAKVKSSPFKIRSEAKLCEQGVEFESFKDFFDHERAENIRNNEADDDYDQRADQARHYANQTTPQPLKRSYDNFCPILSYHLFMCCFTNWFARAK